MFNIWISRKSVGFKKNIKNHGLVFDHNIREDPMLVIGYVAVICIPCICYDCLRKMTSTCNIIQDKYNQGR